MLDRFTIWLDPYATGDGQDPATVDTMTSAGTPCGGQAAYRRGPVQRR